MTPPRSATRLRLEELLADGEWHDREPIVQALMLVVPPGQAVRRAHHTRARWRTDHGCQPYTGATGGTPPRDDQAVGARSLAMGLITTLVTVGRLERRTVAGVIQIRLRREDA